jgi:hypothetical protein
LGAFLPRLLHWTAAALTLAGFREARATPTRPGVRPVQPQLSSCHPGPNTALRLHYSIEAELAAFLQNLDRLAQRLARIQMENRQPSRPCAVLRTLPLFDGKKAMWQTA